MKQLRGQMLHEISTKSSSSSENYLQGFLSKEKCGQPA